ncbi:MAG: hypothetical protein KM312_08570 [Hydrogenibacillus schlegelii]|uniref:Uncharacterized protein n=1 Tax=Hydrogenibacillus schlegelii TaxID=1484 RepID=A0A947CXV2_HYDSH|nr:hypothetical protein [Hydrogenibacillus schlegelii]MBT9282680.1 hypothetical protein [Hydrogenibacillus schlegelii]
MNRKLTAVGDNLLVTIESPVQDRKAVLGRAIELLIAAYEYEKERERAQKERK